MENSYNYKTFYIGTPRSLEECPIIYFFDSGKVQNLSLETLDVLWETMRKEKPTFSGRDKSGSFVLSDIPDKKSFDLIVYASEDIEKGNTIIGYTLFSEPQRLYSSSGKSFGKLVVTIDFTQDENSEPPQIVIRNTFRAAKGDVNLRKYNYPLDTDNYQRPSETYLRYSGRIIDIKNDPTLNALTDCGVIIGGKDYSRVFFQQGLSIDSDVYTEFYLGTYRGDIVLAKLNLKEGCYCVSSVTKTNKFGSLYNYISGYLDLEVLGDMKFKFYAYSYLIFENTNEYLIYFMEDQTYEIYPKYNQETSGDNYLVLDQRDTTGKFRIMLDSEIISEVKKTCITPENFTKTRYTYQEKIGSWWVFKKYDGETYYISPYGCVSGKSDFTLVNERIFKTPNNIFFPVEFGHTYKYPVSGWPKDETTVQKVGVKVPGTSWDNLEDLQKCLLDGLRRKPLRGSTCFPKKILGCIFGIVFYLENGLLYCY